MKKIKIAHLYPSLMDSGGDKGNLIVIKKRLAWYGYKANIINVDLGSEADFTEYDMLFMGGGIERNRDLVGQEMLKYVDDLKKCIAEGLPILFINTAFHLLGTSYTSPAGENIPALGLFNFHTEHGTERMIGNILIKTKLNNEEIDVIGFENHVGRTHFLTDNLSPFGRVEKGYGNNGEDKTEGIRYKNLIATYLQGPLLPKNPAIADFFIKEIFKRKGIENKLILTDELELFAKKQAKNRMLILK